MTDHADFVRFSAASHTACWCRVSHGQGLRVCASREGERQGSTASWLQKDQLWLFSQSSGELREKPEQKEPPSM